MSQGAFPSGVGAASNRARSRCKKIGIRFHNMITRLPCLDSRKNEQSRQAWFSWKTILLPQSPD
jgi:hypothetical protein